MNDARSFHDAAFLIAEHDRRLTAVDQTNGRETETAGA